MSEEKRVLTVKMAKASERDIEAAETLLRALNTVDQAWAAGDVQDFFEATDINGFDFDDAEHLRAFAGLIIGLSEKQPSYHNRIISGMCHVIMYDQNQIVDPNSDHLELHPRFGEMAAELDRLRAENAELKDFARFMCNTWASIESFVYKYCTGDQLMYYPVIQGASNQLKLSRIGAQKHKSESIPRAVELMLTEASTDE